MSDKNPFADLSSLGDSLKSLQNAYSEGLGAIDQTGELATENIDPSHRIIVDINLSANIENHPYKIDAQLEFLADLDSILNSQTGDIASLLGGLGVDLTDQESSQVTEQLGKPRCIAKLDKSKVNSLELHSDQGRINQGINSKATALITLDKNKLNLSFESVFALPKLQAQKTLYYAIPSQEKMQKNIVIDINNLDQKIEFSWKEKDKDNLQVKGSTQIKELD